MIRLKKVPPPEQLTAVVAAKLTAQFLMDRKERVYTKAGIPKRLLLMGRNKCAYCECKLDQESNFLEVDHFKCKETYRDKVVAWKNLLPSCKRCNGKKGTKDVDKLPMVNPRFEYPREHLTLEVRWIQDEPFSILTAANGSIKGVNSVSEIELNHDRVTLARNAKIKELSTAIGDLSKVVRHQHKESVNPLGLEYVVRRLDEILDLLQPKERYAGTTASYLFRTRGFQELVYIVKSKGRLTNNMNRKIARISKHLLECSIVGNKDEALNSYATT